MTNGDCLSFGPEIVLFKELYDKERAIMDELKDLKRDHNNKIDEHCSEIDKRTAELVAEMQRWTP